MSKTIINLICSVGVLITNLLISFFLSPYIISHIGVEANGFVSLANNFITYASLIVTALNGMAARFITMAYIKKDYNLANNYYNSVFWGNWIIVAVFLIPAIYLIINLDTLINVPKNITTDVKILFSFIFFNFFIGTGAPNWDVGVTATNRLDRSYIPQITISVMRCLLLFILLTLLMPYVWYVGLVSTITTILNLIVGAYNTHSLTPELKISLGKNKPIICSFSAIKKLVGSGIWNCINEVGHMLLNGLDLIICNMFLGATEMGVLSLSKIFYSYMQIFSGTICNAFGAELLVNYAKGDKERTLKDIYRAMKLTSVFLTIPFVGIITMGKDFFSLWVPNQDAVILSRLSTLACMGFAFTCGIQILYRVFYVTNKVKPNAVAILTSGLASTIMVFILLKTTNIGMYAIAFSSVLTCLLRDIFFTVPYAAKYLGYKKTQFFPQVFFCMLSAIILTIVAKFIHSFFSINNWFEFFGVAILIGLVCLILNIFIFLNRTEREIVFRKFKNKFRI